MFWRKQVDYSLDIEKIKQELKALTSEIDDLGQKFKALRGLVNRRLYPEEEETPKTEDKKPKTEDLNNLVPKFI